MIHKDKKDEEKKEERKIIDKIVRLFLKDDDFDKLSSASLQDDSPEAE